MLDLGAIYQRIAVPWSHEQLAAVYGEAHRRGGQRRERGHDAALRSPIALLATSIPQSASLSVAVHVLHVLPSVADSNLAPQLIATIRYNATAVLRLCDHALELDGRLHRYTTDEWLPAVFAITAPLLEQARLHREPPSAVEYAQGAVRWISQAIINLDQDTPDAPAAIADALGRLLALYVFTDVAHNRVHSLDEERV